MRLLHRAADALLARLVPSNSAHAAACPSCTAYSGCSISRLYKTDPVLCVTYGRCCWSGTCQAAGSCGSWQRCGNYC
ncbi:hypothetical protein [Phytomonospora endophytica]|uniref:Secreted protein n=1 Tax=Phytomonospora endophytica TaxID=714109 RepID=A0A841F7R1_9ACTN|nr:hypothetical protein [Phytomonospora endophytica]MBB6033081.1 hypothetical protein [Phytomonospora endophytica]GIG65308.1 hypothetical protein Pen01_16030 [Phytomonospora endophytica]